MDKYMVEIIVLVVICALISSMIPKIKGWTGELAVAGILSKLSPDKYRVLNNVMLQTNRGTTQIDHIVVSEYGIFVIETKNYKGWITGGEFAEMWTQNMYGKKYQFRNPLKQNYAHVKALAQLLGFSEDKFIPIVVFSVNAEIRVKVGKPVIYTVKLRKVIKSYKEKKLNGADVSGVADKILSSNIDSPEMRRAHVSHIKQNIKLSNASIKSGICPKCEGSLVKRKGKYGEFMGCSNYPKCRYTIKK